MIEKNRTLSIIAAAFLVIGTGLIFLKFSHIIFQLAGLRYWWLTYPVVKYWPVLFFVLFWLLYSFIIKMIFGLPYTKVLCLDSFSYIPVLFLCIPAVELAILSGFSPLERLKLPLGLAYMGVVFLKGILFFRLLLKSSNDWSYRRILGVSSAAVIIILVFYALWTGVNIQPTGDEPYYLLTTHSMAYDRDLDLENNFTNEDYKNFMPQKLPKSGFFKGGGFYTGLVKRSFGIVLLTTPGYFLMGLPMARFTVIILTWLLFLNLYNLCFEMTSNKRASLLVSIYTVLTLPISFFSSRIYPEILAALVILFVFRKLRDIEYLKNPLGSFCLGLFIGYLPWLKEYLVVISLVLFIYTFYRIKKARRLNLGYLFGANLILAILYIFMLVNFGMKGYGVSDFTYKIYRNLLGFLFDQECGLFWFCPFYLLIVPGIYRAINKYKEEAIVALAVIVAILLIQGSFKGFGGALDMGRHLIPILPLFSMFIAIALSSFRAEIFTRFKNRLMIVTFLISYLAMSLPWLLFNNKNGRNIFLEYFQQIVGPDLSPLLPSYIEITVFTYVKTLCYLLLLAAVYLRIVRAEKHLVNC